MSKRRLRIRYMIYWGWNASLNSQGKKSTGLIKCLISREKSHVSVTHSNYRVCSPRRPALEVSSMRCLILVDKRTTLGALISDIPCSAQSVHSEITKTRHVTEDQKSTWHVCWETQILMGHELQHYSSTAVTLFNLSWASSCFTKSISRL